MKSAPKKIPGLPKDAERVLLEALADLRGTVEQLAAAQAVTALKPGGAVATEGQTIRMRGGERLTLPRARIENAGKTIDVILETDGTLEVVAHRGTVDNETIRELSTPGLYTFKSNGVSGWFCNNSELRARFIVGDPGTEGGGIVVAGATVDSLFKISDLGGARDAIFIGHRHSTTLEPHIVTARSNSDTAAHAVVASGQGLGRWSAAGWDGTDYAYAGFIGFVVDGTPGSDDMPGRFVVATTSDGSGTPTERLRIAASGAWGLAGATYGSAGNVLNSNGSASPPTWGSSVIGTTVTLTASDDVVVTATDDISLTSDDLICTIADAIQATAVTIALTASGAFTLTSSGSSITLTANTDIVLDPTGEAQILGSGVLRIGSGAIEGYLLMQGSTASVPGVAAGQGMFWVDANTALTIPMYTDTGGNDFRIGMISYKTTSGTHNTDALAIDFSDSRAPICVLMCTGTSTIGAVLGGYAGRMLFISMGSSGNLTLDHAALSTTTTNQLQCPGGVDLPTGATAAYTRSGALFIHDGATWRNCATGTQQPSAGNIA